MRPHSSSKAAIGCVILASAVSSQFIDILPNCWQTCIKQNGPQCSDTDLDCACHFASTSSLLPILISCVQTQCTDTSLAGYLISPFGALQTACSQTQYTISDDDVASVVAAAASAKASAAGTGTDIVTATGLTRAHKIATAVVVSSGATATTPDESVAAAATTTSMSGMTSASFEPVVILSATSPSSSVSTATSSSSSKKSSPTSNGGTVLDQAGSNMGLGREMGSALALFSLGVCCLAGNALL